MKSAPPPTRNIGGGQLTVLINHRSSVFGTPSSVHRTPKPYHRRRLGGRVGGWLLVALIMSTYIIDVYQALLFRVTAVCSKMCWTAGVVCHRWLQIMTMRLMIKLYGGNAVDPGLWQRSLQTRSNDYNNYLQEKMSDTSQQ